MLAITLIADSESLVCRRVTAEIVYNVSASRNISKGLAKFGVGDHTDQILVVLLDPSKTKLHEVRGAINGEEQENCVESLPTFADMAAIRDAYDVTTKEESASSLVGSIATRIAVRDIK